MLLKPKIYITVLFLYEIFAVMLLHCQYMCTEMLGATACQDWFRYFAACIVIPGIVSLIWMWIETIRSAYRNRFFRRARSAVLDVWDGLRDKLADKLTRQDLERYIIVASLYGIRYYLSRNPKFKEFLHELVPESRDWDLDEESETPKPKKTRNQKRKK